MGARAREGEREGGVRGAEDFRGLMFGSVGREGRYWTVRATSAWWTLTWWVGIHAVVRHAPVS